MVPNPHPPPPCGAHPPHPSAVLQIHMPKHGTQYVDATVLKGLYWEPQIGNPKNIAGI